MIGGSLNDGGWKSVSRPDHSNCECCLPWGELEVRLPDLTLMSTKVVYSRRVAKTVSKTGSGSCGISRRPWPKLSKKFGSAWAEAVLRVDTQDIVIRGSHSSNALQAFTTFPQSSFWSYGATARTAYSSWGRTIAK